MTDELHPYQEEGARFLAEHRRALLADEMGLGKTVQAIRACDLVGASRVTVVCPAGVRPVWREEFPRWSLLAPEVQIYSYTELATNGKRRAEALGFAPDVLVLDEVHYLKTPTAKRTRMVYGQLTLTADRVWALTGTPMPNNPVELWTHAKYLGGETMSYEEWAKRYCYLAPSDYTEWRVTGVRKYRLQELREKLDQWILRRTTGGVGLELPPLRWREWPVEGKPFAVSDDEKDLVQRLETVISAALASDDDRTAALALQQAAPHLPQYRRLVGLAKVPAVVEEISRELEEGQYEQIVIMAHHRDVLRALQEAFPGISVTYHGGTPPAAREEAVRAFQAGEKKVFLGQQVAAGTGLTLTAAHQLVVVEPDWAPDTMAQAAKRIHRIGQTRSSLIRMAKLPGSLDDAVIRVLARKARMIDQTLTTPTGEAA